ncbi:hypothetical protein [uncultured Parabacteroides sp.]|uniref:hypothetical protein n=1 Tax=uncultured Parabacteroides sp. TaxID=512312 RepID=UPI00258D76AC|nr:hypothetical protein [uncultured Parabacteroides sp.]
MSKSENNHDNSDFQMLKEEVSESEYQNAQYEAEKKKHMSYWVMIIAPFIMILVIFIFYSGTNNYSSQKTAHKL